MNFEEFARQHVNRLIRLGMAVTGVQTDADDFAQDALERLYRTWPRAVDANDPWAYARTVAMNTYLSGKRKRRVVEILGRDHDDHDGRALTVATEGDEVLEALVSQLPKQQRTVLVLRYYEDLDVADIARELGIGSSSVRSSLSRALGALRSVHPSATSRSREAMTEHE